MYILPDYYVTPDRLRWIKTHYVINDVIKVLRNREHLSVGTIEKKNVGSEVKLVYGRFLLAVLYWQSGQQKSFLLIGWLISWPIRSAEDGRVEQNLGEILTNE